MVDMVFSWDREERRRALHGAVYPASTQEIAGGARDWNAKRAAVGAKA
jgi:hypothetical protein